MNLILKANLLALIWFRLLWIDNFKLKNKVSWVSKKFDIMFPSNFLKCPKYAIIFILNYHNSVILILSSRLKCIHRCAIIFDTKQQFPLSKFDIRRQIQRYHHESKNRNNSWIWFLNWQKCWDTFAQHIFFYFIIINQWQYFPIFYFIINFINFFLKILLFRYVNRLFLAIELKNPIEVILYYVFLIFIQKYFFLFLLLFLMLLWIIIDFVIEL